jgi:hypothetical protein
VLNGPNMPFIQPDAESYTLFGTETLTLVLRAGGQNAQLATVLSLILKLEALFVRDVGRVLSGIPAPGAGFFVSKACARTRTRTRTRECENPGESRQFSQFRENWRVCRVDQP